MLRKLIRVWIIGIVFPLYAIAGQPSVKITHGPYLQNLSENEVTVVWTTDKPCKSWVEFSKKEDGKSFYSQLPRKAYASQDGLCCVDTLHRVTVTGLEKNTTYFYRVLSQEVKELLPYRPVLGNIVSTDIWKHLIQSLPDILINIIFSSFYNLFSGHFIFSIYETAVPD